MRLFLTVFTGELTARVLPRLAVTLVSAFDEARAVVGPELAGRLHRGAMGFVDAFYDEAPHATRTPFA